jgi:hypothetical protein
VETRCLQFAARVGKDGQRTGRYRQATPIEQSVDVKHPKPNAFDMECLDRPRERFALLNDGLERFGRRVAPQQRRQGVNVRFRAQTMIGRHAMTPDYASLGPSVNTRFGFSPKATPHL